MTPIELIELKARIDSYIKKTTRDPTTSSKLSDNLYYESIVPINRYDMVLIEDYDGVPYLGLVEQVTLTEGFSREIIKSIKIYDYSAQPLYFTSINQTYGNVKKCFKIFFLIHDEEYEELRESIKEIVEDKIMYPDIPCVTFDNIEKASSFRKALEFVDSDISLEDNILHIEGYFDNYTSNLEEITKDLKYVLNEFVKDNEELSCCIRDFYYYLDKLEDRL